MTISARDGNGRAIRSIETIEQDRKAAELRSRSMTYAQIAAELDIGKETARQAVIRGNADVPVEPLQEARRLELDKLDRIERHLLGVMEREHLTVSHGRIMMVGDRPLLDDGPGVQAAMALLRVQARRSELLGLDAPEKVEHTVLTVSEVERLIAEAESELGIGS